MIDLTQEGIRKWILHGQNTSRRRPDNDSVPDEMAIEQINCHRLLNLSSLQKALNISPNALTEAEKEALIGMINARYDKRIEQYKSGEKLWDFSSLAVLVATGVK